MLASCVVLIMLALAVCYIAFGAQQALYDEMKTKAIGFLFMFFGFMFLFSGVGMHRRIAKAHRTAIVSFAAFLAFGTVYLIMEAYSEQVLLFVISTAICLLISLTKYVADWNSSI